MGDYEIVRDYFFDTDETEQNTTENKVYVLIIYDIIDNKRRNKLVKYLKGYGFRVQKSAFEAMVPERLYAKLKRELKQYATEVDSIRIYRIVGSGVVTVYGLQEQVDSKDVIII